MQSRGSTPRSATPLFKSCMHTTPLPARRHLYFCTSTASKTEHLHGQDAVACASVFVLLCQCSK